MAKATGHIEFKFEFNFNSIINHLEDIESTVNARLTALAYNIREELIKNVLDNANWNPVAVYSDNSVQAGQKYDLDFSGQLLSTISNRNYNTITTSKDGFSIGIGNIAELDSLRSAKPAADGDLHNPDVPYWRFVVFGHRERKPVKFIYEGEFNGKDVGVIVPGTPAMEGTPPLFMFSNGLYVSRKKINKMIKGCLTEIAGEVNSRWK